MTNDDGDNQATVCYQPLVGTTTTSMAAQPISGQSSRSSLQKSLRSWRPMLKLQANDLTRLFTSLSKKKLFLDFLFTSRQFTDPVVLDSLKPQLKLVQSSVGENEVCSCLVAMRYIVSQCYMWFSPNLVWFGFVWLVCHHHCNQVCLYYDSARFAWVCFIPWPPGLVGGDKFCLGRWSAWTFWHLGHLHHYCYHNQYCYI